MPLKRTGVIASLPRKGRSEPFSEIYRNMKHLATVNFMVHCKHLCMQVQHSSWYDVWLLCSVALNVYKVWPNRYAVLCPANGYAMHGNGYAMLKGTVA
jgi:hypothetical protein